MNYEHVTETLAEEWIKIMKMKRSLTDEEVTAVMNFAVWMDKFLHKGEEKLN